MRILWLLATTLSCSATTHDAAPAVPTSPPPPIVLAPSPPPSAAERAAEPANPLAALPASTHSTSIGSCTNGRVEGAVPLPDRGPGFVYNERRSTEARFGTVETIRAIARAAAVVTGAIPDSLLIVNDIGLEHGGRIAHHGSHRAGRDADILFYLLDDAGQPMRSVGAPLDPEGTGFDFRDLSRADDDVRVHFDPVRTWRFVQALLEDQEAEVQRIFVVEHLRARLLAEAERSHAPAAVVARFADVSCQPGYPHDDHLHVRWFCSVEDLARGCQDLPPLYPWRAEALAQAGITPVIAQRTRSEDPAPVTTQAEANAAVARARPHPDVLAFLRRRRAWEKAPHPGRPYCR